MKGIFKLNRFSYNLKKNVVKPIIKPRFLIIYHTFNKSRPIGDPSIWYRVYNFAEKLNENQMKCDIISEDEQTNILSSLKLYKCVIFFRPRQSRELLEVIDVLKKENILHYASYDDLIFDPSSFKLSSTLKSLARIDLIHSRYRDWANAFQLFDNYICSTEYLMKKIKILNNKSNVRVVDNVIPRKFVGIKSKSNNISSKKIGYFGGGFSHKDDILSIEADLVVYLKNTEHSFYVPTPIYNCLSKELKSYSIPFDRLSYSSMLQLCSQMDVAIAPLKIDENSKSKSAIKFTEAALCGTPLVATYIDAYSDFKKSNLLYIADENNWVEYISLATERHHCQSEFCQVVKSIDDKVNLQIEYLLEDLI